VINGHTPAPASPQRHAARAGIFSRLAKGLRPKKVLTVSQWADQKRHLSAKQSAEPGRWRTERNPLLREPMDALSVRSGVHELALVWPIQFGKTEVALNGVGYTMDHDPCPIMVCLPGEVSLNKWVSQKLQPMIDETPAVRDSLSSVASREAANTRTFKDFAGGQLYIEHAGSPSRLKSTSVRKLIVDELDEFVANLQGGDDPVEMLDGRTSAFPGTYQRLYISTPQLRSSSRIWWLWEKSDQRRYHVPCPHCGEAQPLMWPGLAWGAVVPPGGQRRVWYVCRGCGAEGDEYAWKAALPAGAWVPGNPGARMRGYTANCLYYPLGLGPRWHDLVERWLDAQGDPARLKTFINDRLAEPWEDKRSANVKANLVQERATAYPLRTAPRGVIRITAGIDTQDDRLELHIIGWGRGRRFWVLDYAVLPGDPALPDVWAAATDLLNRSIQHASGALMQVEASSFDMLGHRTEHVKHFVRSRRVRRAMASYGAKANTAPILSRAKLQDITYRGKTDKRGVHVFQIGTVDAKHALFAQLAADHDAHQAWMQLPDSETKPAEPEQLCHFSADLPDEYFNGLVSEVYNPSKNRFEVRRGHKRNEPLDTWVHAYAATHHPELRLHRARAADWDRWEADLLARAPKVEGAAAPVPLDQPQRTPDEPDEATPARPKRGKGGWMKRWGGR
jgi:phage terminase large subunit GpA-like protein